MVIEDIAAEKKKKEKVIFSFYKMIHIHLHEFLRAMGRHSRVCDKGKPCL